MKKLMNKKKWLKKNLISNVVTQLQELSTSFKKSQKDYLQHLSARQKKDRTGIIIEDDEENEGHFEVRFTDDQVQKVAQRDDLISQRAEEIKKNCKIN